jgi:coenzyme F420 hydrogenase subunit beta
MLILPHRWHERRKGWKRTAPYPPLVLLQSRRRFDSRDPLKSAVESVVETERCTGCGLCTHLDGRITMEMRGGFQRPTFSQAPHGVSTRRQRTLFRRICPGVRVLAQKPTNALREPNLGPVQSMWTAWSADPEFRHRGASGGVLSTLAAWAVDRGLVEEAIGATTGAEPRLTVPISITSREEALRSAGSRYAPCSTGAHPQALNPSAMTIGKPCEAYGLRRHSELTGAGPRLILSFFCAGTPSQDATDDIVRGFGLDPRALSDLWYRGRGWPGRFTAKADSGLEESLSYSESWGARLGPTVQWRCRTCPDGVGEASDITAGDIWESDEKGHPQFVERPGQSVLIARTTLGLSIIEQAIAEGVIVVGPVTAEAVAAAQPYQVSRRQRLAGRLAGTWVVNRRATWTWGFGSMRWALLHPRTVLSEARGTRVRLKVRHVEQIRS